MIARKWRLGDALVETLSNHHRPDDCAETSQELVSTVSLANQIAMVTPGQKISYIVDVAYSPANAEKIIFLAKDSDQLFIEAAFLDAQRNLAAEKHHLTARQAGEIAARCGARQFTIFHFSPRYLGQEDLLYQEATEAYALNH